MWLDTQDARSRDRNPSNFTLDCVSDHSATKRTTLAYVILRYFCFLETAAAAFVYIFLYPIGYQSAQFFRRALHYARGGRQFLRQRAQPPWGSIYIYIYICVCVLVWRFGFMANQPLWVINVNSYLYIIKYIWCVNEYFVGYLVVNELELMRLHAVILFQVS